jgi:hypothetical protein
MTRAEGNRTTDLEALRSRSAEFTRGQITQFFQAGPYTIAEHHPWVREGVFVRTGEVDQRAVEYHLWIDGKDACQGFSSLDEALVGAVAYRVEGANHRADRYFMAALSAIAAEAKQ